MEFLYKIEEKTTKLSTWFSQKPLWLSITILFIFIYIAQTPCEIISAVMKDDSLLLIKGISKISTTSKIIFACIIGPILETYLLYIFIYLINRFFTKRIIVQILIPSVIFGILHNYSWLYIISMVCVGIVFCFGFCSYYYNRNFSIAFWCVVFIHFLPNLIAITF